jgi:hypothetical protein
MLNRLPLKWSARIIDVFLLEGEKLVLDIYQRIYYLSCNKIMQLRTKNVKNLKKFFKSEDGKNALINRKTVWRIYSRLP